MNRELIPADGRHMILREPPHAVPGRSAIFVTVPIPFFVPGVDDMAAYRYDDANARTAPVMMVVMDDMVFFPVPGIHADLYLGNGKGGGDHPCDYQPRGDCLIVFHWFSPCVRLWSNCHDFVNSICVRREQGSLRRRLRQSSPAADDVHEEDNESDDKQYVDKTPHSVGRHKSEKPEDDENNRDCVKHTGTLSLSESENLSRPNAGRGD